MTISVCKTDIPDDACISYHLVFSDAWGPHVSVCESVYSEMSR